MATLNDLAITTKAIPMKRQPKAAAAIRKLAARTAVLCASTPIEVEGEVSHSMRLAET